MRFKVGDVWYECKPDQPIMVELTDRDKANIVGMAKEASRYAVFDDADMRPADHMIAWMDVGADLAVIVDGAPRAIDTLEQVYALFERLQGSVSGGQDMSAEMVATNFNAIFKMVAATLDDLRPA